MVNGGIGWCPQPGPQSIVGSPSDPAARIWLSVLALLPLLAALLSAQGATGELRVMVNDAAGLGIATTLELTSESNQLHERVTTDPGGRAVVTRLPDGIYRLRVQPPGFGSHVESVEIRSAVPRDVRIVLYPATVQMAVTVTAGDTLVDPRQTTMIARVGEDTIAHRLTPLPGRSMLDLVSTQPGWLLEANGILHPRGSEYQTQYLIDGVPLTDNRSPAFLPDLDVDTVQALRVTTASYPAEYGRKLGGVVDVVTKSVGEDGIHGRASIHGGSDATIGESTTLGFRSGRYGIAAATEAGRTDRFLDPPVEANYTNEGRTTAVFGSLDVTASDHNRLGATVRRDGARFLVPNERVQQTAGQRQERRNTESAGQLSFQRMMSSQMVADVRGMMRHIQAGLTSNAASTPIVAVEDRGYTEWYLKSTVSLHLGTHASVILVDTGVVAQQGRCCRLLRTGRPSADMAEHIRHAPDDICWTDGPTHAQPRRRKGLGDGVDEDRKRLHRRTERDRIDMRRAAEGEHPVHLIVQEIQRTLATGARTTGILVEHGITDRLEARGVEESAGGVQWRVENQ